MRKILSAVASAAVLALSAASADAHTWNIGWKSSGGGLNFYGVSWHNNVPDTGPTGVDNFVANPAGITLNGTNFDFITGTTVNAGGSNCAGGVISTGGCSAAWDAIGVDGAVRSSSYPSSTYGKISSLFLSATDLANIGIGQGANSVTLAPYAPNVHWFFTPFASATVPINIIVKPPVTGQVPIPAALPMLGAGLGLIGFVARRRRKAA